MNTDEILKKSPLFAGIESECIKRLAERMGAYTRTYEDGETVMREGSAVTKFGLVLSGCVRIENCDFWGNKTILGNTVPGQVFAEAYAFSKGSTLMVNAVAFGNTEVMFLDGEKIFDCGCGNTHLALSFLKNLIYASSGKNLALSRKILSTSPRTIRARLLTYLSEQAKISGNAHFEIEFDRQQLADYLNVDRSALSAELSKMRKDGLLTYSKNKFTLLSNSDS